MVGNKGYAVIGLVTAVALSGMAYLSVSSALHIEDATINVQSKERLQKITSSDGKTTSTHEFWVYTDEDAYRVQDSWIQWHFYSGKVYASINPGECNVKLQGYRIGFLSWNKNIISADCKK